MRRLSLLAAAALALPAVAGAQVASPFTPFVLSTATYSQNFDGLASTGTSNVLPSGFQTVESGTGGAADGSYTAGTGSLNAGNAYSFGAAGSTERALGSLTSGTVTPIQFGGVFTNGLGTRITSVTLNYVGEQWRLANGTGDALAFEYSTDATSLLDGTWTRVAALDFAALFSNGVAAGAALDGNATANRSAIGATIGGLSIAAGGRFGFRWTDIDVTGSDQGLAVDDLTLAATTAGVAAVPEPASWALMILGFGAVGVGLRRRGAYPRVRSSSGVA